MLDTDDVMYRIVNNRRMRCGHTTGTCAAAASKAAAEALLTHRMVQTVSISTPKGIVLKLPVEDMTIDDDSVKCAIRKDGGDDIDATDGLLIYATVSKTDGGIEIDGAEGVGRVTRKGLDQPVGNAAINHVPRQMISEALMDTMLATGYSGGLRAVISVPNGIETAKKTFNPRLGIEGGISILGTSGIVEPMSETALIDTIRTEMRMRVVNGAHTLLVVPGNYGKDFTENIPGIDQEFAVKCSNFVGDMLDYAVELKVDILLVSNLGKLVKVAGGIMNTHSRNADCRMEILAANTAMAGGSMESVRRIMECISTDDALDVIDSEGLIGKVSERLMDRIGFYMNHRTGGAICTGAVLFSSVYGLLGKTATADELIEKIRMECTSNDC